MQNIGSPPTHSNLDFEKVVDEIVRTSSSYSSHHNTWYRPNGTSTCSMAIIVLLFSTEYRCGNVWMHLKCVGLVWNRTWKWSHNLCVVTWIFRFEKTLPHFVFANKKYHSCRICADSEIENRFNIRHTTHNEWCNDTITRAAFEIFYLCFYNCTNVLRM